MALLYNSNFGAPPILFTFVNLLLQLVALKKLPLVRLVETYGMLDYGTALLRCTCLT